MNLDFLKDKNAFQDCSIFLLHTNAHWYKPTTWLECRIQIDSGYYNHSGTVIWDDFHQEWYVLESKWQVTYEPLKYYCNSKYLWDLFYETEPLTKFQQQDCEFALKKQIGEDYDTKSVLRIRWMQFWHSYEYIEELEPIIVDNGLWICSRLTLWGRQYCGRTLLCKDGKPLGRIATPTNISQSPQLTKVFSYA
jgi:hypothetical protein